MKTMNAAETIYNQLGPLAFRMMGAKNMLRDERALMFKIGKNTERVTHIRIELAADDTYTVSFSRVAPRSYTTTDLGALSGVYVESLKATIEDRTGLYLTL